jgi:hypothetical protein
MWFTCDSSFEFENFLDGKAHIRYGESKIQTETKQSQTSNAAGKDNVNREEL